MIYSLYQYTHKESGKSYIGITNDPQRRQKEHFHSWGGGIVLNRAIKKNGIDTFVFRILAIFDDLLEVARIEQAAIEAFGTISPLGYNLRAGAIGTIYAGPPWNKGLPSDPVANAKRSAAMKGRAPWTLGKHLSPETRAKIAASQPGPSQKTLEAAWAANRKIPGSHKGIHHSLEARANISKGHKGQIPWNKKR